MVEDIKYARVPGKLVMVGFGIVGQGVLPLLLRHLEVAKDNIIIVTSDDRGAAVAKEYGIRHIVQPLNVDNYKQVLSPLLTENSFLLNLSVDVSSVALMELCQEKGVLYLDTCIEPWEGGYTDQNLSISQRSNYALRETALAMRQKYPKGPTAVIAHGANPGLVSHFVKKALMTVAKDTNLQIAEPTNRDEWGRLAHQLGVKVIHIAERDSQVADIPRRIGEFANTWSVDGFIGEGCQPAELGWGTHEKNLPVGAERHQFGCSAAIYLNRPGASVRVRSWTPMHGTYHGFLITHNESISIADYLTVKNKDGVFYRPTVHYAYRPCDDAVTSIHELAGSNWQQPAKKRFMMDEIIDGVDELGVLLMGHGKSTFWYGSQLSTPAARHLVSHNSATSLQITSGVLAGVAWALNNPHKGIVEADEMNYSDIFEMCKPYLGNIVGKYSDWTPLQGRATLFPEDLDYADPWQFKNFQVV